MNQNTFIYNENEWFVNIGWILLRWLPTTVIRLGS